MANSVLSTNEIRTFATNIAIELCQNTDSDLNIVVTVPEISGFDPCDASLSLAIAMSRRVHEAEKPIKLTEEDGLNKAVYVFGEAIRLVSDCAYFEEFLRLSAYESSYMSGISVRTE